MNLILTLDDGNGVAFNKRRQSRDKSVIDDTIEYAKEHKLQLLCSEYSLELFEAVGFKPEVLSPAEVPKKASFDAIYFLEIQRPDEFVNVEKIIVYKWNRRYPADVKVDIDKLLACYDLVETVEFKGNSHDCITREVWTMKGAK